MNQSSLRLIEAPGSEPIELSEAVRHLRVSAATQGADEMILIESLILAARQHLDGKDGWLNRALITQTWELVLDYFPCGQVRVPLPPLQQVVSIKYDDSNGVEQTVSAASYTVDTAAEPGRVVPVPGFSWPATLCKPGAVRIRFKAGYGDASSNVPEPIRMAMLLMMGTWYENRQSVVVGTTAAELPMAVDALLFPYKVWSLS